MELQGVGRFSGNEALELISVLAGEGEGGEGGGGVWLQVHAHLHTQSTLLFLCIVYVGSVQVWKQHVRK